MDTTIDMWSRVTPYRYVFLFLTNTLYLEAQLAGRCCTVNKLLHKPCGFKLSSLLSPPALAFIFYHAYRVQHSLALVHYARPLPSNFANSISRIFRWSFFHRTSKPLRGQVCPSTRVVRFRGSIFLLKRFLNNNGAHNLKSP